MNSVAGVGSGCVDSVTAWQASGVDFTVSWTCKPLYAEACRCDTYQGSGFTNTVLNTKWSLVTTDPGHPNGDSRPVFKDEASDRCGRPPNF